MHTMLAWPGRSGVFQRQTRWVGGCLRAFCSAVNDLWSLLEPDQVD